MVETNNVNPVVDTAPNKCPIVPSDWMALGAETGYKPKKAEELNLYVVGPSGEGKTTYISSIHNNMILDFDERAEAIPGTRSIRIPIKSYSQLTDIRGKMLDDYKAGNRRFVRTSIDTSDECIAMIKHQLEKEKSVEDITDYRSEGYGYNLILQRFWSIILDIQMAGMSWAIAGHIKYKNEVDPATKKTVTRLRDAVYPCVSKKILTKSDFKLTIYCQPETVKTTLPPKIVMNGGQKIEVPQSKEEVVTSYFLNSLTIDKYGTNKASGVPTMPRKIQLPLIGGWDVFKAYYEKAVNEARQRWGS
ncbi:MAG: AAA family ATPase [Candidatus Bathyarchaeota archaeon]|jgi:hypothetical protein